MSEILTINIFNQADIYLKEIGEFAPFGAVVDSNDKVIPLSYYSEEDIIDSIVAIEKLKGHIKNKISKGDAMQGAIGVNVAIAIKGKPFDALQVIITENGFDWSENYYTYKLESNNLTWL